MWSKRTYTDILALSTYCQSRSGSAILQPGGSFSGSIRGLDCRGHGFLFARAGAAGDLNRPTYDVASSGSNVSIVKFSSLGMSLIRSFTDGTYSASTWLARAVRRCFEFAVSSDVFRRFLPCDPDPCDVSFVGDFDCDFAFLAGIILVGASATTRPLLFVLVSVVVVVDPILNVESLIQPDHG